jgi:hypothetical protein
MLLSSLLLLTFLLCDSGGPAAVDINDVPLVPTAAVIHDVNSVPVLLASMHAVASILLQASRFCWCPFCVGHPVVAFTPAVACIYAVVGSHAIAVIPAVACCWHPCYCLPP